MFDQNQLITDSNDEIYLFYFDFFRHFAMYFIQFA